MSDCCNVPHQTGITTLNERVPAEATHCAECGGEGRSVARQTVLLHVRSEELARVSDQAYRFCPSPNCQVVYYGDDGERFTVEDVRELVTAKASGDERPLCYCFDFNEGQAREEIARTGKSTIPARISRYIKEGICACEVRNPSGACCLGQVNQTIKRLAEEHKTAVQPIINLRLPE
ncbi:MAG: copper chaperone Copz family protein [Pyrinomonadaceae bacterium]|nr:copper chaperone Copz family protein [Pyrinomonadaceae bacterium]